MLELLGSPTINREDYNLRDLSEYTPSAKEHLAASWSSNMALNPAVQAKDIYNIDRLQSGVAPDADQIGGLSMPGSTMLDPADPRARRMSVDEANDKGGPMGLRFSEPPTQGQFDYLAKLKQAENARDETLSHTPMLSFKGGFGMIAGLAATAVDPLNIATAFVPIVGEARYLRMVERMGIHRSRLVKGALEGGVGNALTIPAVYGQAEILQQNYGAAGAFQDLVFGAALGAGLHWGGGAIGDVFRSRMSREASRVAGANDPRGPGPDPAPIDRRKIKVQEGENASIVESMDRNTRAETLRAAIKAVESDTVPKIDALLKTQPELGELSIPDKRFPATLRLRADVGAADFATGGRAAAAFDRIAERLATKGGSTTPANLFGRFAKAYKKLAEYSLNTVSREEFNARTKGLLEHPDQLAALEPGSKTVLTTEGASMGAIRHEIERALDEAYAVPGDASGGYRYHNKDIDGQSGHRQALGQLYGEAPDRAPKVSSPKEAVDLFSQREPLMNRGGRQSADQNWDVVQDLKDKDLDTMIKDEEIDAVESIAKAIQSDARLAGVLDKVIPLEERLILDEAAARQGKQSITKGLNKAVDDAVERGVKGTEALDEAELLIKGGADALKQVILEGKSVKEVVADVVAKEGLVPRSTALRSIKAFIDWKKPSGDKTPALGGAALERAIQLVQSGEDIDVAVGAAGLLARADDAAKAPTGQAADFKAPGEERAEEDLFSDIQADAEELLKDILSKRELAEAEARLVKEEHDLLAADKGAKDMASSMERTEFDEAQRDRALREGSGTLVSSEGNRAGGGRPGDTLEDGLFATRTRRDGEAAGGQGAAAERERITSGGERAAPETAISYGAGTVPRRVITPDSSIEVSVEPKFVELDDLVHAQGDLLTRGPWGEASVVEALARATKLDPEQLMPNRVADAGAPIVAVRPGGGYVIVSGNRRVLSLRHVYGDNALIGKANEYRGRLGPAADGYRRPVLVQVITDKLSEDELVKFAERANRSRIAEMSITEKAQRDADAAGIDLMSLYRGGDFTKKENQPFLRAFMRKVATAQEMGEISKNGVLTKPGVDRLNAAVLASAYDDTGVLSLMLESTDNNIKSISSAYRDAAPVFMKLRAEIAQGLVREEMDITPFMMEAARFVQEARNGDVKIANALAQVDAFHPMDPIVDRLIRQFYNPQLSRANSALRIGEVLKAYAEAAREKRLGGFFEDSTTPLDVIGVAERKAALDATDETLLAPDEADAGARAGSPRGEIPQRAPEAAGVQPQDRGASGRAETPDRAVAESGRNQIREQLHRYFADEIGADDLSPQAKAAFDKLSAEDRRNLFALYAKQAGLREAYDNDQLDADIMDEIRSSAEPTRSEKAALQRLGEVSAPNVAETAPGLRSLDETALRAKLDAMKLPEIRKALADEGIEAKGRSKEQLINSAVEGARKPAAEVTEPGQDPEYKKLVAQGVWQAEVEPLMVPLREDIASLEKKFTGQALVVVERFGRQVKEIDALYKTGDFDAIDEILGDMLDDAGRLDAMGDSRSKLATQWIRGIARKRDITRTGEVPDAAPLPPAMHPHREAFYDFLEGDKPVKDGRTLAKALNIDHGAAFELLDEAIENGWLKQKENGTYIRVPKNKRPVRPGLEEVPSFADQNAFKSRFGKSQVLDEAGEPLTVYHGTREDYDDFSMDVARASGSEDNAFFFSDDPKDASGYAELLGGEGGNVRPVYLRIENPFIIEGGTVLSAAENAEMVAIAKAKGHDGIISKFEDGGREYAVFSPDQIIPAIGQSRGPKPFPRTAVVDENIIDPLAYQFKRTPSFADAPKGWGSIEPELIPFKSQLDEFLDGVGSGVFHGPDKKWELLLKNNTQKIEGVVAKTLTVESIDVANKGAGTFKQLLGIMEASASAKGMDAIYVQNVLTERFAEFFRRAGWVEEPAKLHDSLPSFFKRLDASLSSMTDFSLMERNLQAGLAIQRAVGAALHRVPDVIKFEIMDRIGRSVSRDSVTAGMFDPKSGIIALSKQMSLDPVNVVNHEIFHALRHIKLFTDFEWNIIRNAYQDAAGIPKERADKYRAYWVEEARKIGAAETDPRIADKLIEEWAATDFGHWSLKRASERATPLGMLWSRVKDFMDDLRGSFDNLARRALGREEAFSANDIFRAIEDGSIAQRWEEWGGNRRDATNPMSAKSAAIDEQTKRMNDDMRALAEDKHEKLGRLREEALKALAPCAAYNL